MIYIRVTCIVKPSSLTPQSRTEYACFATLSRNALLQHNPVAGRRFKPRYSRTNHPKSESCFRCHGRDDVAGLAGADWYVLLYPASRLPLPGFGTSRSRRLVMAA